MSWHTKQTASTTRPLHWHHYSEMVAPLFLVLGYRVQSLYILETCFSVKPKHPT